MVLITVEEVSKAYGVRTLFEDVTFGIHEGDRLGIIGPNGAGKTTLLRIIAGLEQPDVGQVVRGRDVRMEYVTQQPDLDDALTAIEQILTDGPREFEIVRAYEHACAALEDAPQDAALLDEVARLSGEMDRVGGWTLEGEARSTLGYLGIKNPRMKIGEMSGGQRRRVAIARALVRPSDVLILDEPTNHLDVETIAWLEDHLGNRTGALVLITHDRYVLERVATGMLELDQGSVYRHEGNYSAFLESRAARVEVAAKREQKRKQLAKQELAWLRRGPKARTTKSKSRIQRAHDLLNTSYAREDRQLEVDAVTARLGRKVLELSNVTKRYQERDVVRDFTYTFTRTERVGIVGPNGAGKSTLLNLITGTLAPDSGHIDTGETVVFGYYDQEAAGLDPDKRVHDTVTAIAHHIPTSDGGMLTASQMLERFLFAPDRQWTTVSKLSGGERRRLYLLCTLMAQPNVLILDEPTNDLDVETLTVLEDYLDGFDGVLLVVSHDRYFLDRTVDHLLVFTGDGQIEEFPGGYSIWAEHEVARKREETAAARREAEAQRAAEQAQRAQHLATQPRKLSWKEARELESLETQLADMDARLAELDNLMVTHATDYDRLQELSAERAALEEAQEVAMERWMELEELAEQG